MSYWYIGVEWVLGSIQPLHAAVTWQIHTAGTSAENPKSSLFPGAHGATDELLLLDLSMVSRVLHHLHLTEK